MENSSIGMSGIVIVGDVERCCSTVGGPNTNRRRFSKGTDFPFAMAKSRTSLTCHPYITQVFVSRTHEKPSDSLNVYADPLSRNTFRYLGSTFQKLPLITKVTNSGNTILFTLGGGHFLSWVGGRSEFQINAQFFHTPPK